MNENEKKQAFVAVNTDVRERLREYLDTAKAKQLGYTKKHMVSMLLEYALRKDALNLRTK